MAFRLAQLTRASLVCCLIFILASPQPTAAQSVQSSESRIVQPSELQNAIAKATATRKKNLDQVRSFFSSAPVRTILDKSKVNSNEVQNGIASLNADELAKLAARTEKVQKDFAAGALSNQDLTYIVIALATAVVILVIVAAD